MTDSSYYDPRDAFVRFGNVVVRSASIVAVNLDLWAMRPGASSIESCVEIHTDDDHALKLFGEDADAARTWFTSDRVSTP